MIHYSKSSFLSTRGTTGTRSPAVCAEEDMSARVHHTSPFAVLRPLQRKLKARQIHSHYVGNNVESLRSTM